jgi:purine nucleoside phosphorylase
VSAVGIITGTGTYALPDFEHEATEDVETPYGVAQVTRGRFHGSDVLHISRHREGHALLSSHVTHKANVAALAKLGARLVIGCTACGSTDEQLAPGSLVVFDDLHFTTNRLPDGSLASFWEPGQRERGHWIYDGPFSEPIRRALVEAAHAAGHGARDGGCYGHVDGPRFNTRTEIAQLAAAGVTAVSQTAGPETVLMGEAEVPYGLIGFATDYANGIAEHTPIDELIRLMGESTGIFASVLAEALDRLDGQDIPPTGVMYRFEE